MSMNIPWWAWTSVAALIGLAELHAPGSYFIWIAIGAGLTAAIEAGWGLSLSAQIGAFAALSAISCAAGYFIYRRFNHPKDAASLNQRNLLMIGAQGVVCADIVNGQGKVRLGDSVWLADGPNLPEGPTSSSNQFKGHASPWRRREPTETEPSAGFNVRGVKDLLGHASFSTMEKHYTMAQSRVAGCALARAIEGRRKTAATLRR
jgi:inner membrane protein